MTLMLALRSTDPNKKLKDAFAMHDTNNNGKLEKEEVKAMIASCSAAG